MIMPSLKYGWILIFFFAILSVEGNTFPSIIFNNSKNKALIKLSFSTQPTYAFFLLHNPERIILDIDKNPFVKSLPINFIGKNILKKIRLSKAQNSKSIRLVFDLKNKSKTVLVTQHTHSHYTLIFNITTSKQLSDIRNSKNNFQAKKYKKRQKQSFFKNLKNKNQLIHYSSNKLKSSSNIIIVAIDAGHGGQDPGAIGTHGLKEKNVTISIARKLNTLLNMDPMFKGVMTRKDDYFMSVMERSDIARKHNANFLISIHADSAPNHKASGASVWILSNRRANSEMANWLEQHEKQSELLGGISNLLANTHTDLYLSKAVLDLQFGHSQRVGYDVALNIMKQLRRIASLHKNLPEHASLGVLRSPDIPSVLVEIGFISNPIEERLMASNIYQNKITKSIYKGLRNYFIKHSLQLIFSKKNKQSVQSAVLIKLKNNTCFQKGKYSYKTFFYLVKNGETLFQISKKYNVNTRLLRSINNLKKDIIWKGQCLKIPVQLIHPYKKP